MKKSIVCLLLALAFLLCGCEEPSPEGEKVWPAGFGCVDLELPQNSREPL